GTIGVALARLRRRVVAGIAKTLLRRASDRAARGVCRAQRDALTAGREVHRRRRQRQRPFEIVRIRRTVEARAAEIGIPRGGWGVRVARKTGTGAGTTGALGDVVVE